jgi:dipeptidase E
MRLVLYSGGQNRENELLHQSLITLCGSRERKRFTYIPFCSDNAGTFYNRISRRYRRFGFTDFQCLPVDQPIETSELKKALRSHVIYLAGGNTFYFLNHLKKAGMMPHLRRFARQDGVLAGLSAGALIMTPNIRLAAIPKYDADENESGLKDLSGLSLTDFEFSPHYSDSEKRNRVLLNYSKKTSSPIYACGDGGGIVIEGSKYTHYGRTSVFHRGGKFKI